MKIIGISPLDKDSTVCLFDDGELIAAVGEERFSRTKMHAGFPYLAMRELFNRYNLKSESIDAVVYAFFDWKKEKQLIDDAFDQYEIDGQKFDDADLFNKMKNLPIQPAKNYNIPG